MVRTIECPSGLVIKFVRRRSWRSWRSWREFSAIAFDKHRPIALIHELLTLTPSSLSVQCTVFHLLEYLSMSSNYRTYLYFHVKFKSEHSIQVGQWK